MNEEIITFKSQVQVETSVLREKNEPIYGYYMLYRPPMPGAMPGGSAAMVSLQYQTYHDELCCCIWGWVAYTRPLTQQEVDGYELLPDEENPCKDYRVFAVQIGHAYNGEDGKRKVERGWLKNEDGSLFTTPYKLKAETVARALNNEAWDKNTKDELTRYCVRELVKAVK